MSISKDNTRMMLTIPKELKAELERIAQEQNRSVNNLILTIIKNSISKCLIIYKSATTKGFLYLNFLFLVRIKAIFE